MLKVLTSIPSDMLCKKHHFVFYLDFNVTLKQHLAVGHKVYDTKQAAYTFSDKLNKIREIGIEIIEATLDNACKIWLGMIAKVFIYIC